MNHMERARRATWKVYADAVAETIGFATPLYKAALKAHHGRDRDGKEFYRLAAELSEDDRNRLWDRLKSLDSKRLEVARQYAAKGLV